MIIKQGGKSPHRYCGARLWIDHSKTHLPLRSRLYEYWGAVTVEGNVYHRFYAYRHGGGNILLTNEQAISVANKFKPFILDCVELGFIDGQQGENPNAPFKRF